MWRRRVDWCLLERAGSARFLGWDWGIIMFEWREGEDWATDALEATRGGSGGGGGDLILLVFLCVCV